MIWPKFTKESPCPACGRADWTCRAGDRAFVCMRVESERSATDGGWYHSYASERPKIPARIKTYSTSVNLSTVKIKSCGEDLAVELGVSMKSLVALGVGWSDINNAWMFPMRNGKNEIVGYNRRFRNGEKKIMAGTKAGLYIPQIETQPMVFICEGGSDTAALLDMGFFAIGRFNVSSGAEFLKEWFRINKIYQCVIIADNDELKKYAGGMGRPGIEGATRLKADLGMKSVIWQPPSPCKDLREFKKRGGTRELILSDLKNKVWSRK